MTTTVMPVGLSAVANAPSRSWTLALQAAALAAALLVAATGASLAQTKDPPPIPHGKSQLRNQAKDKDKKATAEPAHVKPPIPSAEQMAILIQTSVVALSQANLTGNFSVLHALGAPGFQQSNPPTKLAEIFKNLREQNIDLTPVILFAPVLLREPVINEQGMLYLVGYYKTAPQQVHFEVLFQPISGQWRLFGIAVRTVAANQPAAAAHPPAGSPPAAASTSATTSKKTK